MYGATMGSRHWMREGGRDMEPRAVERFSETMADDEPEPQMLVPYGMVNFMGISAESGRDVGRGDHVEAIFRPSVGCLSMRVAVNTRKVGDVLPPTHEVDHAFPTVVAQRMA
jgi:hypothetical protein